MKLRTFILFLVLFLPVNCVFAGTEGVDFYLDKQIDVKGDVYLSKIVHFENPMDRAILSWNAVTPGKSFIKFYLRAKTDDESWSNWFLMGKWGEHIQSTSKSGHETKFGKIDIDTLLLNNGAKDWQYKVVFHRAMKDAPPQIHSMALTVKNSKKYQKILGSIKKYPKTLNVPSISQFEMAREDPKLAKRICSPTSAAMFLNYNGVEITPLTFAPLVYDPDADMYGNWAFNVATMFNVLQKDSAKYRFTTYVRWFESFDEMLENIRNGEPVIVSISFKEGELDGAPIPTAGHLVLIRGADNKYVYVNDPAASDHTTVKRRYKIGQFIKAWKGVAYVVDKN